MRCQDFRLLGYITDEVVKENLVTGRGKFPRGKHMVRVETGYGHSFPAGNILMHLDEENTSKSHLEILHIAENLHSSQSLQMMEMELP